jgi:hypothetical protein
LNGAAANACYMRPLRQISLDRYMTYNITNYEVAYITSNRAHKTNIQPFDDTSTVLNLDLKKYNYKKDDSFKEQIGYVAEDVYAVDPNLTTRDDGKPAGIEYFTMLAYTVNELKKLREEFNIYKLSHP